ncbi:MAG: HD domain-containing phosphohydrolase [Coriobacteriia bacterium]
MTARGRDIKSLLDREVQVSYLAYVIILALVGVVGLFGFALLSNLGSSQLWVLRNDIARTLITGFVLMVVLYLADTSRRLRNEITEVHDRLAEAKAEVQRSYDRLAFAHRAATLMTSLSQEDGMRWLLKESAQHFGADAVAIVGDDVVIHTDPAHEGAETLSAVIRASVESVREGRPISAADAASGTATLTVPLRVRDRLRTVAVMWRVGPAFTDEDLGGLRLVGRVMELALENRELLEEVRSQLRGTLEALAHLVDLRKPDYLRHSTEIAARAVSVGRRLGLTPVQLQDVRSAALLHDVGMLEVPEAVVAARRDLTDAERGMLEAHTALGARLAASAGFDDDVQTAILSHHERLDGSGYPTHVGGDDIPLAARIISVCDEYERLTSERRGEPRMSIRDAAEYLTQHAGTEFDRRIVRAFVADLVRSLQADAVEAVPHLARAV